MRGAEIAPGIAGTWHVARCMPGRELETADWLASENFRFGCYVPLDDVYRYSNNNKNELARRVPLFPGYVFIWLWGLAQHIARVKQVPGVVGFLVDNAGIPIIVPDRVMLMVQKIEFECWVVQLPRGYFRRRRRHEVWTIPHWRSPNHGFRDPDPATRVDALHKALEL